MTQPTVNLSALRPLLFDYEPEQLAKLTPFGAADIQQARAVAEVDILFRLAFLDTPSTHAAPTQPHQQLQPIAPLLAGAAPGDTVRLPGGSYVGSVTLSQDVSIVAGGDVVWWAGAEGGCLRVAAGATVSLSGVCLQQAAPADTMPVVLAEGSVHAADVQVRALSGEGIVVTGAAVLEQVLIDGGQQAVAVRGGAAALEQVRCIGQRGAGVMVQADSSATMQDVVVQGAGIGVHLQGGQAEVTRLEVVGCAEDGILIGAGGRLSGEAGAVRRCQGQAVCVQRQGTAYLSSWSFEENIGAGVLIRDGGRASLHAAAVSRQAVGVVVDVGGALTHRACQLGELVALAGATVRERRATLLSVVVVDPISGGDCTTIKDAVEMVDDGGLIQLRPGRYTESVTLDVDARIIGIGADGDVVWSGREQLLVARGCAVTCQNITFRRDGGLRQDMVWLRSSEGIFTDCHFDGAGLSALVVDERSRLRAEDCRFTSAYQGGIVVREGSHAIIERCFFSRSRMAAIHIRLNSDAVIRECRINNSGQGGVLVYEEARLLLERCEIRSSGLAGVEVRDDAEVTMRECRLLDGQQAAVFVHKGASAVAELCDLVGTTRRSRPGVEVNAGGTLTLRSCRIRGSDAAIRCRGRSRLVLESCDLAGNRRLQDKDRAAQVEMTRCRRGKTDLHLRLLMADLETVGAIWSVPADATDADLRGAFLAGVDLKGVRLDDADLSGAFAPGAQLQGVSAKRASFKHAFLAGASLDRAALEQARFEHCYLRRASMVDAETAQAHFYGADTKGMAT